MNDFILIFQTKLRRFCFCGLKLILLGFTLLVVGADPGRDYHRDFNGHDSDSENVFEGLNRPEFQDNRPEFQAADNVMELWDLDPNEDTNQDIPVEYHGIPVEYHGQGLGYQLSGREQPPEIGSEITVVEGPRLGISGVLRAIVDNRAIITDPYGQTHNVLLAHVRVSNQGWFIS